MGEPTIKNITSSGDELILLFRQWDGVGTPDTWTVRLTIDEAETAIRDLKDAVQKSKAHRINRKQDVAIKLQSEITKLTQQLENLTHELGNLTEETHDAT